MKRIGLVDIGSNTVRLVIFEFDHRTGLNDILNIKTPARLSQYLDADMKMSQDGIDALEETLQSFKKVATRFQVDTLNPIATAALRQSTNRKDIIKTIESNLDISIQIIPEEDEAYYGYYAITHTTEIQDGISIDIGGGSTEVTLFKDKELVHSHSFPYGVVTLQRQFFDNRDHNDKKALKEIEAFLLKQFEQFDWLKKQQVALIGIGGSARNIARIHQAQHTYPISGVHNYTMDEKALNEVFKLLTHSSRKELKDLDGLSRDRTDLITPAVALFKTLYSYTDATQFTFSRKGLREGYIMNLINKEFDGEFKSSNVSEIALKHLAQEYYIEEESAEHRVTLCKQLLEQLCDAKALKISKEDRWLFLEGAYLYYLGRFIDSDSSSPHTFYIIANSNIDGLTHHERVKLALIASFKNKSLLKFYSQQTKWLDDETINHIQELGGIVKFINALNISHTSRVKSIELQYIDKKNYQLNVYCKDKLVVEEYDSQRQKKHIEKILNANLTIVFTKT
ncbi:exopolyphosphatase [Staphylococcus lloydii]|uniref:exopolyphosphatase n=1 Tax=Staphylococcus lloydii TaxID=2781774 RepID=UPI0029281609|nr:exopolyphosphatase [Staphylococcus lloydii]MDU9418731.1 exopolyphosphatase [Staphylococcus lloydii]